MQRVLQELPWKHDNGIVSDLIVFLDDNFAEIFKWDGLCLPAELGVYSLHNVNNRIIGIYRRVVVFTTALDMQVINDILLATEKGDSCECHILTSVPAAMVRSEQFGKRQSGERIGYSVITSILNSVHTTVTYLPMHVVGVVRNSLQNEISVSTLASTRSRNMHPVTLSSLSGARMNRDYRSMADVNVSDLPSDIKFNLKATAYELAGALVFNHGLDVSGSVYALGKTSSIIGHNILPLVEELTTLREVGDQGEATALGMQIRAVLCDERRAQDESSAPLQAATLVLIDRCEDLWSPASTSGSASGSGSTSSSGATSSATAEGGVPLAHRILNTLNYCQYNTAVAAADPQRFSSLRCDVSLQAPILVQHGLATALSALGVEEETPAAASVSEAPAAVAQWNVPMSALTNLPLQLNPSLHLGVGTSSGGACLSSQQLREVQRCVLVGSEEEGRVALCGALRETILAEKGVLPAAKKRGLGAEMLAYVQALVQSPSSCGGVVNEVEDPIVASAQAYRLGGQQQQQQDALGYNFGACARAQGLLSVSLAVIEAMQRSPGKQLQQLCAWQCAYEVRAAREAELDAVARRFQDLDVCVAHLMSYFLPGNKSVVVAVGGAAGSAREKAGKAPAGAGAGEKDKEALATSGPLDLTHILIQLIRLVSIFRQSSAATASSNFGALSECICDYILNHRCEAELVYLEGLRFLSPGAAQEVLTYRTVSAALDALLCADVGLARDLDHTASGAGGVEEERAQAVEEQELRVRQLQSSVRDQVGVSLHRLLQLQVEHAAQRQALLASKEVQGEVALADRLLDLQKPFPSLDNHESGLVARIVQLYLTRRAALHRAQSLCGGGGAESGALEGDGLHAALEFIESPLEQMKRAGLGLLSKGLGSLFGGQVATAASAPHPAERPVLVVFVLGGLSFREAGQVQQLLKKRAGSASSSSSGGGGGSMVEARVVLLTTRLLGAENVVYQVFC